MGGGGGGRGKKKNSCQGKLREKNSCTVSIPEKMFLHTEKNIPAREMLKKNRAAQKFSTPPPHNSSNSPSLNSNSKIEKFRALLLKLAET